MDGKTGGGYAAGRAGRLIRDLPGKARPREIAMEQGVERTDDAVLLAILLRTGGRRGQGVLELARDVLGRYGHSLERLAEASAEELVALPGLGPVKALELKAALELGRRAATPDTAGARPVVLGPGPVVDLLGAEAARREQEVFWMLPLNAKYRLLRPPVEITRGLLDASLAHPREVFREAVRAMAAAIVLAHNHPSGDPKPSREDVRTTRRLVDAGRIVGIPVLDHVVIGRAPPPPPYASLRESGAVQFDDGNGGGFIG